MKEHASSKRRGKQERPPTLPELFEHPVVGQTLTVLASLACLLMFICLPLVGRAGVAVPWARQNFWTFLGVLLVFLFFAGAGFVSKWLRRKKDGSPFPLVSAVLLGVGLFFLVLLLTGWVSL